MKPKIPDRFHCRLACAIVAMLYLGAASAEELVVFKAAKIITMDASQPLADAVAVRDGRIIAVGSVKDMKPWLDQQESRLDTQFKDKVLLPGFIEPHLHPFIAAVLLPMHFVTPHDWNLPDRFVQGVKGKKDYLLKLRQLDAELQSGDEWLFSWGYHQYFHGDISRQDLDKISSTRPILVWHRSFHEIFLNSKALEALNITPEKVAGSSSINYGKGHFYENGTMLAVQAIAPMILAPERYIKGLHLARNVIHRGGITTVSDGAFGMVDLEMEWAMLKGAWENENTPFRSILLPDGKISGSRLGNAGALELIESLPARNTHRLIFPDKAVKLFADGAFYSQLMQMGEPGYIDGHEGEWLMQPDELEAAARTYWNAGYQINVHANGDEGVKVALDVLQTLQRENFRLDHRYALHHFGYSTSEQSERLAALGGTVSANPYYLWALGDKYAEIGLGYDRASRMVRLGSLARNQVRFSFHSDFTMAPAEPLTLAWVAVNRLTASGQLMGPEERISVQQALSAITIDAAHLLRKEDEIGSIRVGKLADFTVLYESPFDVPQERLKDIRIWGTIFEGSPFPLGE
jgi:predicted amidohydrolase YtcJ